jgi:hypothetical protein
MGSRTRGRLGRLTSTEPAARLAGADLDPVVARGRDDLDDEERAALHAHLAAAWESVRGGKTRPVADILAELPTREWPRLPQP